ELTMDADYKIPKKTDVVIIADGFMGGKKVYLEYERPCEGSECAESGAFLNGKSRGLLSSMIGTDDLGQYIGDLKVVMNDLLDSLNQKLLSDESNSPIAKNLRNLEAITANLKSTTGQMDVLLRRSSGAIESNLANLDSLTGALSQQRKA